MKQMIEIEIIKIKNLEIIIRDQDHLQKIEIIVLIKIKNTNQILIKKWRSWLPVR